MQSNSTIHHGGFRTLLTTTLCSLFLAACGGGGGGGGGGGSTTLTSEQQTAIAAKTAAGTAQFAQSFAQSQTESSGSGSGSGTSSQTSSQMVTQGTDSTTCAEEGRVDTYDNADGINDTDLDIGTETFPDPFSGSVTESDGTPEYYQVRANCTGDGLLLKGSADIAVLQVDTGKSALAYRAGGFSDYPATSSVDTSGNLDIEFSFSDVTTDISIRGVVNACNGCADGDLTAFSGTTTDLDTATSAWLDMSLDFGEGTSNFTLGNGVDDRFTLVSSAQAPGTAAVNLNGRLAVDNPGDECDFDVTYATNDPVVIEGFDTTEGQMTIDGDLSVTNNDTGDTFNVTYDSDGNVYVDGERVDVSDEEEACTLSSDSA